MPCTEVEAFQVRIEYNELSFNLSSYLSLRIVPINPFIWYL